MKTLTLLLSLVALICRNATADVEWVVSASAAMDRARAENKTVLLDFTGSDWCPWCIKLKNEVFNQPEFASYAKANLIMVEVDFPRHKELAADQQAANQKLAETYKIRGYPSIILIDSLGNQVGASGYVAGGPKPFIESLERNPGFGHHAATVADSRPDPAPPHAAPVWNPPPSAPPIKYGDLTLKSISGTKDRRVVLINDETLVSGETARVKTHDHRVSVTIKEIRDDSVLIVVDGKPGELRIDAR